MNETYILTLVNYTQCTNHSYDSMLKNLSNQWTSKRSEASIINHDGFVMHRKWVYYPNLNYSNKELYDTGLNHLLMFVYKC
jgi:hypothetical protein